MRAFSRSESSLRYNAKAVYYPDPSGGLQLARVQMFSYPVFKETGWEDRTTKAKALAAEPPELAAADEPTEDGTTSTPDQRAIRRARRAVFDLIMCNHDLDAFVTLTYAPERVSAKDDYTACYRFLRSWLSNGVQRRGLKYVCVPELTKRGDVHFHALANSGALKMATAINPHTGTPVRHHGDPVYNLIDWGAGFSTVQLIRQRKAGQDARLAVAKYMFKYMTKNMGAKVGGRYALHGGRLAVPFVVLGDGVEEFTSSGESPQGWSVELPQGGTYTEYDFTEIRKRVDSLGLSTDRG